MGIFELVALALAIIAFRRTSGITTLNGRLAELEREVAELRRGLGGTGARQEESPAEPLARADGPSATDEAPSRDAVEAPLASPVDVTPADGGTVSPPPPPAPRRPPIDWERWIGVQGAAVLGGSVLALAGLLFFRYSIEHGLIPPTVRVIIATLTGLACVAAPERPWRTRYPDAANALAGAGIVILYAAFWAAKERYDLIGLGPAFALMTLVTAAGCLLAVRHASLSIAVLGLVGGFLTPFLLAGDADNPIGLFGYILLLDVALLVVARRRNWPLLGLLSLVATALYQALWIGLRMTPERSFTGLVILGVFAVLFAASLRSSPTGSGERWLPAQAGGVLLPFAFAVYFALDVRLGPHLYPLAALLLLLSGAAAWTGRAQGRSWIGTGAAAATVGIVAVWLVTRSLTPALAWEAAFASLALAAVFHGFVEIDRSCADLDGPAAAGMVSAVGLLVAGIAASILQRNLPPWPWLVAWLGLGALLLRHGSFPGRAFLQMVAGAGIGVGLGVLHTAHGGEPAFPAWPVYLGVMLAIAVVMQGVAIARASAPGYRQAEEGAALLALFVLLSLGHVPPPIDAPLLFASILVFGVLVALTQTRIGAGDGYLAATIATAVVHSGWTLFGDVVDQANVAAVLALQCAAVVLFTLWPLAAGRRFGRALGAWRGAALAGPAWFLALRELFVRCFGDRAIGVLPIALGALALVAASRSRDRWAVDDPMRRSVLAWLAAIALGFVSVAIPLQLEKSWMTIGWALEACAVALLWRRLDHPGLKYFAVALAALVTARLTLNHAVLGYYPRPAWRIVNWLLYTYLVPAAALVGAARVFAPAELARLRPWERNELTKRGVAPATVVTGLGAVLVTFVWINLAIADWFGAGPHLVLSFQRLPARDLSTSIAWALYALVLLGIGMARATVGLRWLSLGFLVLTIGKVFLYDLGELRDLYRVMSLLGLAASLILVSFAYQRFIFRNTTEEER
ncbi:MAG TPA: DUF2339 domain-containing protein [Candidatus Binatia bacterium]